MTAGHKHRHWRLNKQGRVGGVIWWLLQRRVHTTQDITTAELSSFPYVDNPDGTYSLRVLGVLHHFTGLTIIGPAAKDRN